MHNYNCKSFLEAFSSELMENAMCGGFIMRRRIRGRGRIGRQISYLVFINDSSIFYEVTEDQFTNLNSLLLMVQGKIWTKGYYREKSAYSKGKGGLLAKV